MNIALYQKVHDELYSRIRAGGYQVGTTLPSETKLSDEFGVSLITIRRALHELALDGLVESRHGVGHFVLDPSQKPTVIGLSSFTSDVASGRLNLIRTLMADDMIPASAEVSEKLGVQPGSMLRHLVRLDCQDNQPFSIDEVLVPPSLAAGITPQIAASPLFMHLWQENSGLVLVRTQYDIHVASPSGHDFEMLKVTPDIHILVTEELSYDTNGRAAIWIESRYRGDRCRLSGNVTLVQKKTQYGVVGE